MNIGIIGAGRIAKVMADTIRRMNEAGSREVTLYGIASRSMEKSERFAAENGVEKAYGSYEELMRDEAVDLVYIAVPHSHHYETVKLALSYGKHVLCEKAFTVNAAQAREVLALAEEAGLLLTEAIWTRYQPMRAMIQEAVFSGIVGEPKMLQANLGKPISHKERIKKPELAGGVLLDMGVYALNFAEMVFGRSDGVSAFCSKNEYGMDMNDTYTLTFPDGRLAVLYASVEAALDSDGVIYCTEGYIRVRNINNPESISIYDRQGSLLSRIAAPPQLTGYEYEVKETYEAIRDGKTECASMPHAETVHMMELMDEIRRQYGIRYPFEVE